MKFGDSALSLPLSFSLSLYLQRLPRFFILPIAHDDLLAVWPDVIENLAVIFLDDTDPGLWEAREIMQSLACYVERIICIMSGILYGRIRVYRSDMYARISMSFG